MSDGNISDPIREIQHTIWPSQVATMDITSPSQCRTERGKVFLEYANDRRHCGTAILKLVSRNRGSAKFSPQHECSVTWCVFDLQPSTHTVPRHRDTARSNDVESESPRLRIRTGAADRSLLRQVRRSYDLATLATAVEVERGAHRSKCSVLAAALRHSPVWQYRDLVVRRPCDNCQSVVAQAS